MKKNISLFLIIVSSYILQSTLCQYIAIANISPNLLIITIASLGYLHGKKCGILAGFISGLFVDIFFGSAIGLYALILMYIGYFNGCFKRLIFKEDLKQQICLIAISDFLYCLIIYLLMFLLRGRFQFPYYLAHIIIPEVVYTILLTLVLNLAILLVQKIRSRISKRSTQIIA